MSLALLSVPALLSAQCTGDTLNVVNPSFEGPQDAHVTPSPWDNCLSGQTPDTQPGNWGVTMAPTDSNSYVGFVNEYCQNWQEGASQQLSSPMTAGTQYNFTLDLASPGSSSGGITDGCIELQVWGGWSTCDQAELLWTSPILYNYTTWSTYNVSFTPSANYSHITLISHEPNDPCADCSDQPYIMVDNMTPIQSNTGVQIVSPANGDTVGCSFTVTGENTCPMDSLLLSGSFNGSPLSATLLTDSTWEASVSYPAGFSGADTIQAQAFFQNGDTGNTNVGVYVDGIDAAITVKDISCNGACDGKIELTANGGVSPYQYSIDGGSTFQSNGTFTALCPGTYNVVINGSSGCSYDTTLNVTQPPPLVIDDTIVTDVTCNGVCDGGIEFQVSGGTAPYQYSIDSGASFQSSNTFGSLCAGTYDIVVQDDSACQASGQVTIEQSAPLTFDTTVVDLACYGDSSGSIHFENLNGGVPPYQFSIDGGSSFQNDSDFTALSVGTYDLVLEDSNGCQSTGQVDIGQPTPLDITGLTTDSASCSGMCDGQASITVSGGSGSYSYNWSGGISSSSSSATGICAGNYTVTVTDDSSCTVDTTFSIGEPPSMNLTVDSVDDVDCFGDCGGAVFISVGGGVAPYYYQWNDQNSQTTQDATGLCAGSYKVVVVDDNGCRDSLQVTIDEPAPLNVSPSNDTTICIGGTATLSASASGGTPPYTFHWSPGLGTGQVQTVTPGSNTIYSVYVEDANGCTSASSTVSVELHPALSVDAFSDDSICPGKSSTIAAFGSGGSGQGYTYTWSNGDQGNSTTVSPGSNTTYTVTFDDNCETPPATDSVNIYLNELPDVQLGDETEGCAPVNATLVNETDSSMVGSQCIWDLGNGEQASGCDSIQHQFDQPGCHDVGLTVTSPEGCVDSTTVQDLVCVRPYPDAAFEYQPKETDVRAPGIDFTNLSTGAVDYRWDFGGLDTSTAVHPSYEFPSERPGTYDVCLKAENTYGCQDSICKEVVIEGRFILYVPNAFTPDGDGINDRFGPVVQGADESDYHFYIYDRWGEV
ncbi:MAG: PKD domain-containing protein, partial [Flavobacteriales bacterium]